MIIKEATSAQLELYFFKNQWIDHDEKVQQVSIAGDGNMNFVVRIKTNKKSFICKQSAAYVEKYPQIAAPENRVQIEAAFYQKIKSNTKLQQMMPEFLGIDPEYNCMILEDLGEIQDYTSLYQLNKTISDSELISLTDYLNELHQSFQKAVADDEMANAALKKLNFEHIFIYPFLEENGFDLDTIHVGLQAISMPFKTDLVLKTALENLSKNYLASGKHLLHGDFYPGSWFNCNDKIKIIDPEFCFYGCPEFDLGVLLAHLHLTNHHHNAIELVKNSYINFSTLNLALLDGFIGVEIMRRIIGLAQLPLNMNLVKKQELLDKAKILILRNNV